MDRLTYNYDSGNKLLSVGDTGTSLTGFNDRNTSGDDYDYDINGNMTVDKNKGITSITYNHLNLPTKVTVNGKGDIQYVYDAVGGKQRKILSNGTTTDYAGNQVYENNVLQFFNHPEGYVEPKNTNDYSQGFQYTYQFKDHLDNVRLVYSDSDNSGSIDPDTEIIQEKNYYPFGLKHKGYNNVTSANANSVANKFGFGGKEEQNEFGLNWIDITARNYDPALGRWMNLDPLAALMTRHSPYNYAFDNPIFFVDPDGQAPRGLGGIVNFDSHQNEEENNCCGGNPVSGIGEGIARAFNNFFGINPNSSTPVEEEEEEEKITRDGIMIFGTGGDGGTGNGIIKGTDRGNGSSITVGGSDLDPLGLNPLKFIVNLIVDYLDDSPVLTHSDINENDSSVITLYTSDGRRKHNEIEEFSTNQPTKDSVDLMRPPSTLTLSRRKFFKTNGVDSVKVSTMNEFIKNKKK